MCASSPAAAQQVEHGELAGGTRGVDGGGGGHQLVEHGQELGAPAEAVQRAGLDEAFERPLVDLVEVDPVAEFFQAPEGAALFPRRPG